MVFSQGVEKGGVPGPAGEQEPSNSNLLQERKEGASNSNQKIPADVEFEGIQRNRAYF